MTNKTFNLTKKIFVVSASSIISILVLIFMIINAKKDGGFYEGGFEFDEKYVYFLYSSITVLICSIYNLVKYLKYEEDDLSSKLVGGAISCSFLLGYYSKIFFKALNKYGSSGFNSTNLILFLIFLFITIYFYFILIRNVLVKYNVEHKKM
jgi:hypothetical protein